MTAPPPFQTEHNSASGIRHLTLNQPARLNTMTPAFFPALRGAVRALDDAGQTRMLIISATGKHVSAGMALRQSAILDADEIARAIEGWQSKQAAAFEPLGATPVP